MVSCAPGESGGGRSVNCMERAAERGFYTAWDGRTALADTSLLMDVRKSCLPRYTWGRLAETWNVLLTHRPNGSGNAEQNTKVARGSGCLRSRSTAHAHIYILPARASDRPMHLRYEACMAPPSCVRACVPGIPFPRRDNRSVRRSVGVPPRQLADERAMEDGYMNVPRLRAHHARSAGACVPV